MSRTRSPRNYRTRPPSNPRRGKPGRRSREEDPQWLHQFHGLPKTVQSFTNAVQNVSFSEGRQTPGLHDDRSNRGDSSQQDG